jgi:hypothetical protein
MALHVPVAARRFRAKLDIWHPSRKLRRLQRHISGLQRQVFQTLRRRPLRQGRKFERVGRLLHLNVGLLPRLDIGRLPCLDIGRRRLDGTRRSDSRGGR